MPQGFTVVVGGPLAEGFRVELGRRGYVQPGPQMALLADLSEWMASRHVAIDELDWSVLDSFGPNGKSREHRFALGGRRRFCWTFWLLPAGWLQRRRLRGRWTC